MSDASSGSQPSGIPADVSPGVADRLRREQDFHNQIFADGSRERVGRWYEAARIAEQAQDRLVMLHARDKVVLEYGCADGDLSLNQLRLPEVATELHGIDISDYAVGKAAALARRRGYDRNSYFHVTNAESTSLPSGYFDVVFGRGIIHHLNVDAAFGEIARLLRPDGMAIFLEPMGHNPLINWYRRRTPELRTPDEHPLVESDFQIARKHFGRVYTASYALTSLAAIPLRSPWLLRRLEDMDQILFRWRIARRNAWFSLMVARKS
jgi:SAM-dependent methyltransferase